MLENLFFELWKGDDISSGALPAPLKVNGLEKNNQNGAETSISIVSNDARFLRKKYFFFKLDLTVWYQSNAWPPVAIKI